MTIVITLPNRKDNKMFEEKQVRKLISDILAFELDEFAFCCINNFVAKYVSTKEFLSETFDLHEEIINLNDSGAESRQKPESVLIKHNLRLVTFIAMEYSDLNVPRDELILMGLIGLIKAANTFDLMKENGFKAYALRCIENEIMMRLRRRRYEKEKDIEQTKE